MFERPPTLESFTDKLYLVDVNTFKMFLAEQLHPTNYETWIPNLYYAQSINATVEEENTL